MSLQQAIEKLAKDVVSRYVKPGSLVGLGSGSTAAYIVREMASLKAKDTLLCVPTSLQIKVEAEKSGLRLRTKAGYLTSTWCLTARTRWTANST